MVAIQAGTTVRFVNDDPEPHDVYSPEGRYNLGVWPTGETKDFVFEKPGVYRQLSNIHPDMLGFVVVLDTPFYAVTDEDGASRFATCRRERTGSRSGTRRRTASRARSWSSRGSR